MNISAHEPKCNSFVFLDLETTGIPFREDDGGRTKITEICLISIPRSTLSKVHYDLPRSLHKLTTLINPMKMISDKISRITGLDNMMLKNESPFDEKKASSIKYFLEQCKRPICLVAHNGFRFDFPLLKEELIQFPNIIPEDTRFVDTLWAFRELFHCPDVDEKTCAFNPYINDEDLELVKAAEAIERKFAEESVADSTISKVDMTLMQMLNETTPLSQKIICAPSLPDVNSKKRKLFVDENSIGDSRGSVKPKQSFTLPNVYLRIFGTQPPNSHRAEDDTETMIKCCLRFGQPILDYFDRHSQLYSTAIRATYSNTTTNSMDQNNTGEP